MQGSPLRDEAADVLRCLRESLREPGFITALVRLVSGDGQDEQCEIAERRSSGGSAENGEG